MSLSSAMSTSSSSSRLAFCFCFCFGFGRGTTGNNDRGIVTLVSCDDNGDVLLLVSGGGKSCDGMSSLLIYPFSIAT